MKANTNPTQQNLSASKVALTVILFVMIFIFRYRSLQGVTEAKTNFIYCNSCITFGYNNFKLIDLFSAILQEMKNTFIGSDRHISKEHEPECPGPPSSLTKGSNPCNFDQSCVSQSKN